MERQRFEELMAAHREGSLDRKGLGELLDSLRDAQSEDLWTASMRSEWERMRLEAPHDGLREELLLERLMMAMQGPDAPVRSHTAPRWRRMALAAAVLSGLLAGGWWIAYSAGQAEDAAPPMLSPTRSLPRIEAADRITLVRDDGSKVFLDAMGDGLVEVNAATAAVKGGDGIRYDAATPAQGSSAYNTIATPRGGRFRITLSDGSRIWLNAASSLRFPVVFPSGAREVEVTGQAYFEVAREKGRPFRVRVGESEVEVLGTHFDIMAYPDEGELRTTLVEGAVRFRSPGGETRLTPGQQSYVRDREAPRMRNGVDVESILAWREGVLEFRGDDIGSVCRTLSRAYDVTLAYDEAITERFHARFPQETGLETVLKALEMTGKVHFERRGGTIWARP